MKTHLYDFHKKNARMTEFAGFEMPLWYEGIIQEHLAVRNSVGIFDVTHMGRYLISGRDSEAFLNNILTKNIASLNIYQGHVSMICNENGGIVDDVFIFRLEESKFLLICNAVNRRKDYEWIMNFTKGFSVEIKDVSDNTAMFAIQGPKSQIVLQAAFGLNLGDLDYNYGKWIEEHESRIFVSRTGYTGEDGFEIILWDTPLNCAGKAKAYKVWEAILEAGREFGIKPCGLGARDTLRIEAGFCLYGNDIDETITPLEAKLDFAVDLEKQYFIGKKTLLEQRAKGVKRVRVGIRLLESGIIRPGYKILFNGETVGRVTSGTFSPILKCGIGMGYVPPEISKPGTKVKVLIREKETQAEIAKMPFYDTTKYGRRRIA